MNPLAQTFFIDKVIYPDGIFVTSVDLFFKTKDDILPIGVSICPTVNGFPYAAKVMPYSEKFLYPADVNISTSPDATSSTTRTRFTFQAPVYLKGGDEYALCLNSDSKDYQIYIALMGENTINPLPEGVTARRISEQPYSGSLFRSQNSLTWTPFQNQDLMFVLNKAVFDVANTGSLYTTSYARLANTPMDMMYFQTQDIQFSGNTSLTYGYQTTSNSTGAKESTYTNFLPGKNISFNDATGRRVIAASNGSMNVKATLSSQSPDISPMLDLSRQAVIIVENAVNNLGISNSRIVITNPGAGYVSNSNISVTITSTAGSGANAHGYINANTGKLVSILMDAEGSDYSEGANVTITGGGATTNATAAIATEISATGGNARARYISRRIALADGFDGGDLRVFLDAYKPSTAKIYVYYKILNNDDSTPFDSVPWQKMSQATLSTILSTTEEQFNEYEFRPSLTSNTISYTSGTTTFNSFKYAAIKIVMGSSTTVDVPRIKRLRIHALPAAV